MLNKIKQAQKEGRILPDVIVDYNNVSGINPIELINQIYPDFEKITEDNIIKYNALDISTNASRTVEIKYKLNFEQDYYIVRLATHDGTMYFTYELYEDMIKDVVTGLVYCKNNTPDNYSEDFWNYDIEYTLGNIYHFMDFGIKDINGKEMHGQTDVMVMPVKIEYVKNNDGVYEASQ